MRITQQHVNEAKLRFATSRIKAYIDMKNPFVPVTHIRFPDEGKPESYSGPRGTNGKHVPLDHPENVNPPPQDELNPWERGLDLVVDIGMIPPSLTVKMWAARDTARSKGLALGTVANRAASKACADHLRNRGFGMDIPYTSEEDSLNEWAGKDLDRQRTQRDRMKVSMKKAGTSEKSFAGPAVHSPTTKQPPFTQTEGGIFVPVDVKPGAP